MATSEKSKTNGDVPDDLLPVLKRSGILAESRYEDIRGRVLAGDLPIDSADLARSWSRSGS